MKRITLALSVLLSLGLVGCANTDELSGSVYTADQAKEARSISYGTIVSTRPVKIQADNQGVIGSIGGGVIGGIAGSNVGGGSGQAIASAIGVVAGAVIGSKIEEKASQVNALEMVIKKDDGKEIVVVQKAESNLIPGARVRIVGGSTLNVSAL